MSDPLRELRAVPIAFDRLHPTAHIRQGLALLVAALVVLGCEREDRVLVMAPLADDTATSDGDGPDGLDTDDQCVPVALPEPIPATPLLGEDGGSRVETATVDGYEDTYLDNATGLARLGFRSAWGGALVFFGLAADPSSNLVDASAFDRGAQVILHDPDRTRQGCSHDASCAADESACELAPDTLGWNPIQGGDRCGGQPDVAEITYEDDTLVIETRLVDYNPNWDRADCESACLTSPPARPSTLTLWQSARFISPHVVELLYTVTNTSGVDRRGTYQELPSFFGAASASGPAWQLVTADGVPHAIDQLAPNGIHAVTVATPAGWAALQGPAMDYGVGIYHESHLAEFQGWRAEDNTMVNFRGRLQATLPGNASVNARSYLLLGSLDTIRSNAAYLEATLPPFGVLDAPALDEVVSGPTTIRGWALDNRGVSGVALYIDGVEVQALSYGRSRLDVCLVWPGYAGCPDVGFEGTFDFSTLTPCPHLLEVVATDGYGNERVIANTRVQVAL